MSEKAKELIEKIKQEVPKAMNYITHDRTGQLELKRIFMDYIKGIEKALNEPVESGEFAKKEKGVLKYRDKYIDELTYPELLEAVEKTVDFHSMMERDSKNKIDRLEAENKKQAERIEELEGLFGMGNPWSLLTCTKQLVLAANHLLIDHDCDGHGYELTETAKRQMQKYIEQIEQALKEQK